MGDEAGCVVSYFHTEQKGPHEHDVAPSDLMTYRQASSQSGVSVELLRHWVSKGKGSQKLKTYYTPGNMETPLVSLATVRDFQRMKTKGGGKRLLPGGRISLNLDELNSATVRRLSLLLTNRIGVPIAYAETVRLAVAYALRNEEARLAARQASAGAS